ncbi:uncharacterized protein LOC126841138 [Adelges cooleyi]|uniref:uncharacterized protein LOC126841138 n=1 Tax=Adelges cooleyi TaxID=133065 RepID=UPI00217F6DD3|nr:uncharacterized protein LOC126841138 [Adelges cooleyi]
MATAIRLIVLFSSISALCKAGPPGYDGLDGQVSDTLSGNFSKAVSVKQGKQIVYPCKCEESMCSCCSGNVLQNFNLNLRQRLCANISYYADDFEFNVRLLYNDYTLFNRVVSGKNPRPICVPIFPPAWTRSRVCLRFKDVYFVGRNIHMCLAMEAQTEKQPVFAVEFNCIRMGTAGVALLKPEEGGGLPPPPVPSRPPPEVSNTGSNETMTTTTSTNEDTTIITDNNSMLQK